MANGSHSFIAFLFIILNVLVLSASFAFAGREIPVANAKNVDKKQPQSFIDDDGSVLIPGLGRFLFPKPGTHYDPITYNPITGTNGGNGLTVPGFGSSGGSPTGTGYVPGGDDTFVPNPGVEVPSGGSVPAPSSP